MMKIVAIDTYPLVLPVKEVYGGAAGFLEDCRSLIVRVETENGIEGWGEAYGPAKPAASAIGDFFAPLLIGRDPRDTESLWHFLFARSIDYGQKGTLLAAISALDIACWDIKARAAGLPLYRLLGASETESVPCYATGFYFGGPGPLERKFEREAELYLQRGFRAVKMKVGLGAERDAQLVAAVRKALGPGVRLMIDANHAYDPPAAIALARRVEQHDIFWFEEPVSPLDIEGYLAVKGASSIAIAGGECEYTRFGFEPRALKRKRHLVERGAQDCDAGFHLQHPRDAARLGIVDRPGGGPALLRRAAAPSGQPDRRGQDDRIRPDGKSVSHGDCAGAHPVREWRVVSFDGAGAWRYD